METPAERQAAATDPRLSFQPPFNAVSEFRDPGRVNINTVAGEIGGSTPTSAVWSGIMHDGPNRHDGPSWEELANSRGGYGNAIALALNPKLPTLFANPFRSPDSCSLVPQLQGAGGDPYLLMRSGIDCTLLRSVAPQPQTAATTPAAPGDVVRFAGTTSGAGNEFRDSLRHQHFQFQPITRLANLVTTRSNVYAVWVTIGFFEVEPAPTLAEFGTVNSGVTGPALTALYNKVYPSGYQLAKEDGVDTGEIRRLRGFYMIDRTMPAAFEPGVDHNVESVIRLRRRIE
jgi:hypothetical protein